MESVRVKPGEVEKMKKKFPDRVPVLVTRSSPTDPDVKKHKFLVPMDFTFADMIYMVRKWLTLPAHQAIFLHLRPVESRKAFIPESTSMVSDLHERYHHPNGVLYFVYSAEATFG